MNEGDLTWILKYDDEMELLPLQWVFPNLLPYSNLEGTSVKPDLKDFLQNISLVFFNLLNPKTALID